MSLFRGKSCLYGCLGTIAALILAALCSVGFVFYKLRKSCSACFDSVTGNRYRAPRPICGTTVDSHNTLPRRRAKSLSASSLSLSNTRTRAATSPYESPSFNGMRRAAPRWIEDANRIVTPPASRRTTPCGSELIHTVSLPRGSTAAPPRRET